MATITVKNLLDIVVGLIQDTAEAESDKQWPMTELVRLYNIAVLDIVIADKRAKMVTESVKFATGSKQSIPAKSIAFVELIRNMGTDGVTPGQSITPTSMTALSAFNRDWSNDTAQTEIYNVIADPNDPRAYYIYPPSDGTGYGLLQSSKVPDKIVYDDDGNWESAFVDITDEFVNPLLTKIMELVYKKDSDIVGNKDREDDSGNEYLQGMAIRAKQ